MQGQRPSARLVVARCMVFLPRTLTSKQASTKAVNRLANTRQIKSETAAANSDSASARSVAILVL